MKIRYAGAPRGIFRIKVPPKMELVFNDGICEVDDVAGIRLLVSHSEYSQVLDVQAPPEVKVEDKEQIAPEIPKKVGRPAKKIEEIPSGEDQQAIKEFVKQI